MAEDASFWRGRKVLVTGCTGLLGGAVARELLARDAEIVGLINEEPAADIFGPNQGGRVHLVRGRADNVFRLHSAMAVHEIAAIFHLAAHEPNAPDRGTSAVLQAVNRYSRRVPVVTTAPLPQLALARTEDGHDERLTVVRFGEVFGPGDRKLFRTVPATAIGLLTGDAPRPVDGPARDFVFVRDAARACLRAAETGAGEYAFRSGWLMTDRQMAAAVRDTNAGRSVEAPDAAPVANPFDWRPERPLSEALNETLAWYREFLRAGCSVPVRAAA